MTKLFQGLDCVLACGAFEQSIAVVFEGDALAWLRAPIDANQLIINGKKLERDPIKLLRSLPLYDITEIFVLDAYKAPLRADLDELTLSPIGYGDFQTLVTNSQFTLGF